MFNLVQTPDVPVHCSRYPAKKGSSSSQVLYGLSFIFSIDPAADSGARVVAFG